ncbi:hypothetical protein D3C80_1632410 [compost metagenome]
MLKLIDGLTMVCGIEHNRFLIAHLINHAINKVIDIHHRIIKRVNQLIFGAVFIHTYAFRRPFGKVTRITLRVVEVRTLGMQDDHMLAIRIAVQRILHFVNQQHVIHALTPVTRLGTDLLTVSNVLRHGVAVEPHFALHRVQIGRKPKLA